MATGLRDNTDPFGHLLDDVADLVKRDLRVAKSQLRRLIVHLFKLEHAPADPPRRPWLNRVEAAEALPFARPCTLDQPSAKVSYPTRRHGLIDGPS